MPAPGLVERVRATRDQVDARLVQFERRRSSLRLRFYLRTFRTLPRRLFRTLRTLLKRLFRR